MNNKIEHLSVEHLTLRNIKNVEEMESEGRVEKEVAGVLVHSLETTNSLSNSIKIVVETVNKLSKKVDSLESSLGVVSSDVLGLKESVDLSLQQHKDSQEKIEALDKVRIDGEQQETIRLAKKEMFSELFANIRTVLHFLLLIAGTSGIIWAIWKYLVQSAIAV